MRHINSELAYEHIRRRILSGAYPPNHALMTVALAAEIGVSRTPVREALGKLEVEGLVDIRAHLGARVKSMDFTQFRELCGLRLALESHAAGLAASNRTPFDLQEMQFALEGLRRIADSLDRSPLEFVDEFMREDVRFHVAVIRAARNQLLKKEILRLHLIHRVVSVAQVSDDNGSASARNFRWDTTLPSHVATYEAVKIGDVIGAEIAMKRYIEENMARTAGPLVAADLSDEELSYVV